MANFSTHIGIAAVGSGMLATLCLQVGFVDAKDALLLASAGVIGGILPDIDLHYSYPSRIIFSLLGILFSFLWIFSAENDLSIVELWLAGLGIYLIVRYPVWKAFNKFTVHRGVLHSIIMAVLVGLLTVLLCFYVFTRPPFVAWFIGLFVFLGFILHLLLDEIYSVDFMGHRLKRSFGTALKLYDTKRLQGNILILMAIAGSWALTPDVSAFIDTLSSIETYQLIWQRMY